MRYLRSSGLAALAMATIGLGTATMAPATELDDSAGMLAAGAEFHMQAEGTMETHLPVGSVNCKKSTISGKTANTGGASETAKINIESASFTECNMTVTVLVKGVFEIHTDPTDSSGLSGNGTLTSTGMELTTVYLGFHCIYRTNNTSLGALTGSATTKGAATLDISATMPRTGGSSGAFCGSTAQWTGAYSVISPSSLDVT